MDKMDPCNLNRKGIFANTVWQWRIMHVRKYSKNPEPFLCSNKIGLDFNVGSTTKKKKDVGLLTNGVVLEVCDFAKTVKESKRHLITNILEKNFDLGLENEQQRADFTKRILLKLEDLIRTPLQNKHKAFPLFDTLSVPSCTNSIEHGQNVGSAEHQSDSLQELMETDYGEDEAKTKKVDGFHADDSDEDQMEWLGATEDMKADACALLFPYCEEIGLSFDLESQQHLDPDLLTKAVMLELVDFSTLLNASYSSIVLDVLDYNFELDVKSQQGQKLVWSTILHLLKRRKQFAVASAKLGTQFENEPFSIQTNPLKRPQTPGETNLEAPLSHEEVTKKRKSYLKREENLFQESLLATSNGSYNENQTYIPTTLTSHFTEAYAFQDRPEELPNRKKMCLANQRSDVKEAVRQKQLQIQRDIVMLQSDVETDNTTDSENWTDEDDLSNTRKSEINVVPPFTSQDEQQMLLPTTAPNECDTIPDEMGSMFNMWKFRSKRVNQILLQMSNRGLLPDYCRRQKYLEFDVGFAPKQNLHPDQLKYFCLFRVAHFALAMNSSKSEFIMDILENNFDLGLQSAYHKHVFSCEMMTRTRDLQNCEDAVKFSKQVFKLPVPMSSEDMEYQIVDEGNLELSCMTGTGTYDVPLDSHFDAEPGSHAEEGTTQQESVDPYPFCKDIGLKLYVSDGRPNQKLHINKLTKGAMTEIIIFAEKLCGSFEQICFDILRHNFDLDLQSVDSDLFQNILRRIPAANDVVNLACYVPSNYKDRKHNVRDASVLKELQYQSNSDLEANNACPTQAPTEQNRTMSNDNEQQHDINLLLWKLRSNCIQRILSAHEHCPLFSYSRCKKLGIDFNVGSGIKKNLDPMLLTNGVMVELHTFASALLSSEPDFMTEVLEYNFDLNLNTEHLRSAYAEELWSQFMKIKVKRFSVPVKKSLFKIPGPGCIKEYTPHCSKCCQDRNQMLLKDVYGPNVMFHRNLHIITDTDSGNADSTNQRHVMDPISAFQASDSFFSCYRECSKVGLNLCLDNNHPNEKLKTHEITAAAMLELFSFAKRLCGTGPRIILDILVHNFNFDLQKPFKHLFPHFKHDPFDGGLAWFNEVYGIDQLFSKHAIKKTWTLEMQGIDRKKAVRKRILMMQRKKERALLESDSETDETTDSENWVDEDDIHNTPNSEQQILLPATPTNECDLEEEGIGLQSNMWKLRAKRVKQILFEMSKHERIERINKNMTVCLEFNVGFTPKQNFHPDKFRNVSLLRVARFALAMNSSKSEFIMDILENNFDLGLQSAYHKHVFSCEMMKRARELQNCEDAVKFSKEVFELPVPMSSEDMEYQIVDEGNLELSCMTGTGTYDVPLDSHFDAEPGSHAEDGTTQQKCVDPYPFCKDIGLKLYVSDGRPNQKLHINKLTKGAMTEIIIFAEKLCGSFEQICFDILRHNFDLDLQSVDSDLFQNILRRIPAANDVVNLACYVPSNYKDWKCNIWDPSVLKELQYQSNTDLEANNASPTQAPTEQNRRMSADTEQQHGINLVLWKLRSNRIQRILSAHEELCPLFSYSRCKKLGIDFNVGSGIKKNLDPKLLTNGVMVELHTFASALLSSETDFMAEVMEYNFDLNLNTEPLRSAYAEELWSQFMKIKRKRLSVSLKKSPIEIPGPGCIKQYTPHCSKCYQDRNQMLFRDVFQPYDMFHHNLHVITATDSGNADSTNQRHVMEPVSTFQTSDSFFSCYRECSKVGLNLCLDNNHPNEKLKTHEITAAAMLELFSFVKRLCGTRFRIVLDILDHNLNFDLLKPSKRFTPHFKHDPFDGSLAWFHKVYVVQERSVTCPNGKEWCLDQRSDVKEAVKQQGKQGKQETVMLQSDVESEETRDSENWADEDHLQDATNSEINGVPPFASQFDKSRHQGHEQQMLLQKTAPNECDMKREEMGSMINMWRLRSKRVKQILQMKHHDFLKCLKRKYLEFDVGFAPKQNLHPDQLIYSYLFRVALFALAMNSSKSEFIMDILENNFDLGLQSAHHKHVFTCEMMTQARELQNCEDAVKFSKEVFELPVPMSAADMENQIMDEGNLEFSCMTGTGSYDLPLDSHFNAEPGSHAEDGTQTQQKSVDPYPFCKDIGLQLYVSDGQPNQKLHINKLTKGAMTEITIFAEKLCGSFEQICFDILRHNFDLDLQSVDSDLFQNILRHIPAANDIVNLQYCVPTHKHINHPSVLNQLHYQTTSDLDANYTPSEQSVTDHNVSRTNDTDQQNDFNSILWKLRSNRIKQILSVHEEHCPLYSYSRCKKLGIDFNIGSGVKQNLDRKFLTNGLMVELHTFASWLMSSTTDFMTDILEYNFDLNLNTVHLRSAFGKQLWHEFSLIKSRKASSTLNLLKISFSEHIKKLTPHCMCTQVRNQMLLADAFEQHDMLQHHLHAMTDPVSADANCTNQYPAIEFFFPTLRGHCREIGLSLYVDECHPKEKLKTCEITSAALYEVFTFAKKLSGTRRNILLTIIEHNFNLNLEDIPSCEVLMFYQFPFDGDLAWFKHIYVFHPKARKLQNLKQSSLNMQRSEKKEAVKKKKLIVHGTKERVMLQSNVDSDQNTDSENWADEDHLHDATHSEMNVDPQFASQSDDKQQAHEQQMLLPTTAPDECGMIQEEIGPESNMWKLRANRVKKILFDQCKDHCQFFNKKVYLEFNVGFMPKQNLSADIFTHSVLFRVAQFAIAMSSSQPDFIMKILENNFDLCLGRVHHEDVFTCELMKKLRELQSCEDAVKFSKEVFELPDPLSAEAHPHTKADSPAGPDPHVKTKPVSQAQTTSSVDPYPFCKDIGMKLNVGNSQHNKKLHIHRLTKGAMTEVAAFAEKLCGTFDDICFDILRHNFDLDLPSVDCELFQNILAQIPAANDTVNLATISCHVTPLHLHSDPIVLQQLPCQPKPNEGEHSAVLTQAVKDHNFSRLIDAEEHDRDSFLWTLRANRVWQILSVHGEHCPLYSYSRCKKLGIDFNIGSGEKRDLDPKLLTNGIMIELQTFAKALVSSKKDFMTEILEYNFDLNLRGELHRSAYAQELMKNVVAMKAKKATTLKRNHAFEIPDPKSVVGNAPCCPKCYQDRNYAFRQDESNPDHIFHYDAHTKTDIISADCTTQKPVMDLVSDFPASEALLRLYPHCENIGLNLCVDKDHPKESLDMDLLTWTTIREVCSFAKTLSGKKQKILGDVLAHNFHLDVQNLNIHPSQFCPDTPSWFDEVFVLQTRSPTPSSEDALKIERKKAIKRQKVQKHKKAALSDNMASHLSVEKLYPLCSEIGLDLDVTSKSENKEKLDLNLLTIPVILEIQKFISKKVSHYFPSTLYDILDHNFDLSSQHHRKWEFSLETASRFRIAARKWKNKSGGEDTVFKLPFVFHKPEHETSPKKSHRKKNKSHKQALEMPSYCWPLSSSSDDISENDDFTGDDINMEMCDNLLPGNLQVKEETCYVDVGSETENFQYFLFAPSTAESEGFGMLPPCSNIVGTMNAGSAATYFAPVTGFIPVQVIPMSENAVNISIEEEQEDMLVDLGSSEDHSNANIVTIKGEYDP
ncbi:uncharacterized protein LOC114428658 isoform X1 [Parambassis ranga]|uniref:Uncharacterized protein LOC114428658 isoform X1 n=1 Tax=Parambassis ranga TaxID=210632 RepID=A0A6P7HM62_9TELE|nr:uncharacterized protein LOC114428658 isoform X1 [Parambassis ranga]